MTVLENKIIVYDDQCRICRLWRNAAIGTGLIESGTFIGFSQLSQPLLEKIDNKRFRNEMALVDKGDLPTLYGLDGFFAALSYKYKFFNIVFKIKWLYKIFWYLYRVIAYNRFILFLPLTDKGVSCSCEPCFSLKYRVVYILISLFAGFVLTALYGMSFGFFFHTFYSAPPILFLILTCWSGWALQSALACLLLPRAKAMDYLGHLGTLMTAGALVVLPAALWVLGTQRQIQQITLISALICVLLMIQQHIRRAKHLEISRGWTASWIFFEMSGAIFWIWFFHIN